MGKGLRMKSELITPIGMQLRYKNFYEFRDYINQPGDKSLMALASTDVLS